MTGYKAWSRFLPAPLRHAIYRSMVVVPLEPDPDLLVRIAQSDDEIRAALSLLHDDRVTAGFLAPNTAGVAVTLYHALPATRIVVAVHRGRVVGTITLVRNTAYGLPSETMHSLGNLPQLGNRLGEIADCAVRTYEATDPKAVFLALLKFTYRFATDNCGLSDILMTLPIGDFDRLKAFVPLQKLSPVGYAHPHVPGSQKSVVVHLNLRDAYNRIEAHFSKRPIRRNLFAFLSTKAPTAWVPTDATPAADVPGMSPAIVDSLFNKETDLFARVSDREKSILRMLYQPWPEYEQVLPEARKLAKLLSLRNRRYQVDCEARIRFPENTRAIRATIKNVSVSGLSAVPERPIRFGSRVSVSFEFEGFEPIRISAVARWRDKKGVYGFSLEENSIVWDQLIEHMERLGLGTDSPLSQSE